MKPIDKKKEFYEFIEEGEIYIPSERVPSVNVVDPDVLWKYIKENFVPREEVEKLDLRRIDWEKEIKDLSLLWDVTMTKDRRADLEGYGLQLLIRINNKLSN